MWRATEWSEEKAKEFGVMRNAEAEVWGADSFILDI